MLSQLIARAVDRDWRVRVGVVAELCDRLGDPVVDAAVRRLLLDPDDTGVCRAAAETLLSKEDDAALRHYLWALGAASRPVYGDPADDLHDGCLGWAYELSLRGPEAQAAWRDSLERHALDADPDVAAGAKSLLGRGDELVAD